MRSCGSLDALIFEVMHATSSSKSRIRLASSLAFMIARWCLSVAVAVGAAGCLPSRARGFGLIAKSMTP